MKCPNCKTEIGENELVCPNCKKVLRLKCSNCGNITKNTICEKCGSVILNKCYKCGKLNSTALEKCPNCGMDINASIGLRESVIEEFAVLTIDITNFDDIKSAFKSEKIKNQFKTNLYSLVKKTAYQKKLRTQFFENTFIIRFCKDYSFVESCKSAIDFSVFVAQSITEINQKLFDAKGIALKVQMAIQKRDIYSKPEEYKSGVNIDVVYSSSGVTIYNNIETIVDSYVYQATKEEYPFQSLSALYIKNRMVMFFELMLSKIIKPEDKKDGSVIAVTSAQAKEGKTFCTANLGAALAEAGYKVLLIDCDTGKRGLQSYFGTANEKGLMNILSNETDFDHTVKRNLNNLKMDVLFCGNQKVNSANLMISPKFKELMEKLKKQYDYAFLDVSCHLGSADIVSAGSTADSVLLLVRAGKTEGAMAKQTIEALKRANLDVSGVILNGVDEE